MKTPSEQLSMFQTSAFGTYTARARVSDDLTSHEAAARVNRSGKAQRHAALVLDEVRRRPGQTAAEIGAAVGLEHVEAQRRLSDLLNAREVAKGDPRACGVKGSRMVVWLPAEAVHG